MRRRISKDTNELKDRKRIHVSCSYSRIVLSQRSLWYLIHISQPFDERRRIQTPWIAAARMTSYLLNDFLNYRLSHHTIIIFIIVTIMISIIISIIIIIVSIIMSTIMVSVSTVQCHHFRITLVHFPLVSRNLRHLQALAAFGLQAPSGWPGISPLRHCAAFGTSQPRGS